MDWALVGTAFLLGLRHGIDWDHIAAITDISGSQPSPRRSIALSVLYAGGHGVMVVALGALAVIAGDLLPGSVDAAMERVVGVTLLMLGVYVFYSLYRYRRGFRMRSRWMLLIEGVRRALTRRSHKVEIEHEHDHDHSTDHEHDHPESQGEAVRERVALGTKTHSHTHRHVVPMPADPFMRYGNASAFLIGVLHGVGAETPTQVVIFVTAAGAAGVATGLALLVTFVIGLFVSNTVVAIASAYGFGSASRSFVIYASIGVVTGVVSLILGTLYLLGKGSLVPPILGG